MTEETHGEPGETVRRSDLACPRCGEDALGRYYGPCESCRNELRATQTAAVGEVETPEYEPKMNVTPNAVATKD